MCDTSDIFEVNKILNTDYCPDHELAGGAQFMRNKRILYIVTSIYTLWEELLLWGWIGDAV